MNHRSPRSLAFLASLCSLCGCSEPFVLPTRPNVVLIMVDTLRGDAVHDERGLYETPQLDRLRRDGLAFPYAFSHAPMTLPSHTALFSSRPALETTVLNNGELVPGDLPLLAEWMRLYGYQTRAVTSLGTLWAARPTGGLWRGFDDYDLDYWQMSRAEDSVERMRQSLDALRTDQPFFFFAHFSDPHEPYNDHSGKRQEAEVLLDGERIDVVNTSQMSFWQRTLELDAGRHEFEIRSPFEFQLRQFQVSQDDPERPWTSLDWQEGRPLEARRAVRLSFEQPGERASFREFRFWINDLIDEDTIRQRYVEEVAYVDHWIGELLDELRARGLYDNSLIVFTSDHGEALGEKGRIGHVNGLTDPHIHVPLILKTPRRDPREKVLAARLEQVVPQVNLVPTVLEMVGMPPLPGQLGVSLLREQEPVHFAETHAPEAERTMLCLRDRRFKMIHIPAEDGFELYDLEQDPTESTNVFEFRQGERPDWADRLRSLAALAEERRRSGFAPDTATRENLEALGYGGGE